MRRFELLSDPRYRAWLLQALLLSAVVAAGGYLVHNTLVNLSNRGISTGFDFLGDSAGFGIIMSLIEYSEASTYGRAFVVGLLNTLLVSALGILLSTLMGFLLGIGRLSPNPLLRGWSGAIIGTMRNIPLLLHIFFWYFAVLQPLPGPRQALSLGDAVFLSNRGLVMPKPEWQLGWPLLTWDVPVLQTFNFTGGMTLIPEFLALLFALSIYTAGFVAEIVRSGIQSVPKGQVEAGRALGLHSRQLLRRIVLPQALRVIVPPLTNQYLNLTKNSSLAVAIAYPDLVSVFAGTVLNQTGQAVEVIALTMAVYLVISLSISAGMNLYNRRIAARGGAA